MASAVNGSKSAAVSPINAPHEGNFQTNRILQKDAHESNGLAVVPVHGSLEYCGATMIASSVEIEPSAL